MRTLTPSEYKMIRNQLDFRIDPKRTILTIGTDFTITGISFALLLKGGTPGFFLAQLLLSIVFFRAFCITHECGHGSAAKSRKTNDLVGHVTSLFCFLPYFSWKHSHNQHHAWSGNLDKDPSLGLLKRELQSNPNTLLGRVRRGVAMAAWISWLPLLGISQTILFWSYPFTLLKNARKNRRKIIESLFSTIFLIITYSAITLLLPELFNLKNFIVAMLLFFSWVELINFPHHMNTEVIDKESPQTKFSAREQTRSTRSCYYPKFFAEFFLLNFNFHIEHHLFPKLPWHQLRKARQMVKTSLGDSYNEEIGIKWNLKHRKSVNLEKCFLAHTPVRK